MSPTHLHPADKAEIDAIRRNLNSTVESIRRDRALSDSGRREKMAIATKAARDKADTLKRKVSKERTSRKTELERRLFGVGSNSSPTDLLVLRDSRDRAAALGTEEQATFAMRQAHSAGDEYMAKAIAQVAILKGWTNLVDDFRQHATAETAAALDQLAQLPSGRNTDVADSLMFTIRAPQELAGYNDWAIDELAATGAT
jgi:hypothetical protein